MAHKNKTLATTLALVLGTVGAHRFYLHGAVDRLGLLHLSSIPIAGLIFSNGGNAQPFFALLPLLLSCIAGCVAALTIGLTPDDKWDARFNAASGKHSRSSWVLAVILVLTLMAGATLLIATIARTFDLLYTGGAYG